MRQKISDQNIKSLIPNEKGQMISSKFIDTGFVKQSSKDLYSDLYSEILKIVDSSVIYNGKVNSMLRALVINKYKTIYDIVNITREQLDYIYEFSDEEWVQFNKIQNSLKLFYKIPN